MDFSRIGFGCYRVDHRIEDHQLALKKALTSGINLIDTSANYADGNSEILVGNVLEDLSSEGTIKRSDVTLVTKVGYIQGQNYRFAERMKENGTPFNDVVEYADKLWHCISPDFLEDQINRQLFRLNQSYIDVYLLHNPEYYLGWAHKNDVPLDEAREEYYMRIKKAFEFMEEKIKEGKIRYYGISSNTFPEDPSKYDFTSLENVLGVADSVSSSNNFKFIQLPFNLFEVGAIINKNQEGNTKTVLGLAAEKGINVLINRPLNAITSKGLVRLADFPHGGVNEKDFISHMKKVMMMEEDMVNEKLPNYDIAELDLKNLKSLFKFGHKIDENWKFFGSIEHFNDVMEHYFVPRLSFLIDYFDKHFPEEEMLEYFNKYMNEVYKLLNMVSVYYKMKAEKRSRFIHSVIDSASGSNFHELSLSQKAIALLNSIEGVSCVLVGARREKYVDDVTKVLDYPKIENANDIFLKLHEELMKADYSSPNI